MDSLIVVTAFGMFFMFFIMQVVIFRFIEQDSAIKWLFRMFLLCLLLLAVSISIFIMKQNPLVQNLNATTAVFWFLTSGSLFTLICAIYILGIFGVMTSSIRMEILNLVGRSGNSGILIREIENRYSTKKIIAHRLNRFIASGELRKKGNQYLVQQKYSYFLLHMTFSAWLKNWFTQKI